MGRARIRSAGDSRSGGAGARRNGGGRLRRHRARRLGISADRAARALRRKSAQRGLALVGGVRAGARSRARTRSTKGIERAVRTATLLAELRRGSDAAVLVLSDDNASVPNRTARAGRIRAEDGLSATGMGRRSPHAPEQVARGGRDATGLRTVFHHHCAGYVETPAGDRRADVADLIRSLLGLCLDTGHLTYGGGDPVDAIAQYARPHLARALQGLRPGAGARAREPKGGTITPRFAAASSASSGAATVPFRRVLRRARALHYARLDRRRTGRAAGPRHAAASASAIGAFANCRVSSASVLRGRLPMLNSECVYMLAADHRWQWEEWCDARSIPRTRIPEVKRLASDGFLLRARTLGRACASSARC